MCLKNILSLDVTKGLMDVLCYFRRLDRVPCVIEIRWPISLGKALFPSKEKGNDDDDFNG